MSRRKKRPVFGFGLCAFSLFFGTSEAFVLPTSSSTMSRTRSLTTPIGYLNSFDFTSSSLSPSQLSYLHTATSLQQATHRHGNNDQLDSSPKRGPSFRQRRKQQNSIRKEWLREATHRILTSPHGSLSQGKWHELTSLFHGWAGMAKFDRDAPLRMEALLKRLLQEEQAQDRKDLVDIEIYNRLLDAWACAALFKTHGVPASQRAREILVTLQESYEQHGEDHVQPNQKSFDVVLHAVTRTEGPLVARRLLAWKEHLYKTGKNKHAQPKHADYVLVLDAYSNSRNGNAGSLAEGLLAHMKAIGNEPDTYCYNVAIKAWTRSKRGREAAEHAERVLEEMETEPDIFTYATVISAWAHSGMKAHAVSRAEELLRTVENHPVLEPNTIILNAVMSAWVKAKNPASVNRTFEILQQMEECEHADLISFNTHLHALALHGDIPGNSQRAERMLERLEQQRNPELQPNLFSYNCALASCSKSTEVDAAVRAIGIFQRLLQRGDIKPDSFAFNQLLLALSRSSIPDADVMTRKWLSYMEECDEKGLFPRAKPDSVSYMAVISAYSRSGRRGAAGEAEKIFQELHHKYQNGRKELKPNKYIYNAMIDCWAKSKEGTFGARKAEALLQEMQKQYEAGDVTMQPDLISYNGVLNAWALSNTRCCARQAEIYLERMWKLHQQGNEKVKPDDRSYNTVSLLLCAFIWFYRLLLTVSQSGVIK